MGPRRYGIALGSNLGDRLLNLQKARDALVDLLGGASAGLLQGKIYETPPIDCPAGSGSFLNTVVEVTSDKDPLELLRALQQIENRAGRERRERNAPRVIDLDLLYAEDLEMDHPDLTLPHPRMHQRLFVLRPLNDIRPELFLEKCGEFVARQLEDRLSQESDVACFADVW